MKTKPAVNKSQLFLQGRRAAKPKVDKYYWLVFGPDAKPYLVKIHRINDRIHTLLAQFPGNGEFMNGPNSCLYSIFSVNHGDCKFFPATKAEVEQKKAMHFKEIMETAKQAIWTKIDQNI